MFRKEKKSNFKHSKRVILTLFFLLALLEIALLTGSAFAANSQPSIGTLTPASGTSSPNQAVNFTTTFIDPDGYSDMRDSYIIINSGITGLQGFYGFYDQINNKLYLINDQANGWLGGYTPGSSNVIENSFAKLDCSQSVVFGSGTTLTITWNIIFKPCFTGYKNIYLFARDYANATSGWVRKGSWTLANASPSVGTLTPSTGSSLPEEAVTFTTTYTDPNGYLNLNICQFLVNTYPSFSKCLYAYYDQNLNWLYLRNDTNTGWLGGFNPGSGNIIENSYAKLDCSQTTVSGSGTTLTIAWRIIFKSSFSGNKNCYLYVKDDAGAPQGWKQKGTWTITNTPPQVGTVTPSSGSLSHNQAYDFTTTYTDPDGYLNIWQTYLIINSGITGLQGFYGFYDQSTNKLYLINDQANGWLGGYAPGSGNVIENSFVKLDCSKSAVFGSGITLTITWNITFKPCFTGTKNAYLYMRDFAYATGGWLQKASFSLPNNPPSVGTVTPSSGSSLPDKLVTFTATFTDPDGFLNIRFADIIINTSTNGAQCCFVEYDQNNNLLYLRNDDNTGWQGNSAPGSWDVLENSYVKLYCHETQASGNNDTLTITYTFMLKSSFAGAKNLYLYTKDDANYPNGWAKKGSWIIVDTTPPQIISVSPQDKSTFYENDIVLISPAVNDTDSSPLEYQFSIDGVIKQAWSNKATYDWTAAAGKHNLKIEVKDLGGQDTELTQVYILLKPIGPP